MKYSKLAIGVATAMGLFATHSIAEEAQEVETIVVTGQKIDRTLKETPNSVVVVTTKDLEQQNAQNISDVFAGMANVAGDINQGFNIRGIDAFNVSGAGNSYLATMYVDGSPLPYRAVRSGSIPVWDLAQVEVFRGPQSTLQGRNALAGAVHIRTQDPTYEWGGKAKLTLGNNGQREYAFAGGGALIDDLLAFRVAIEDKSLDGDIYNSTRREDSNYEDIESAKVKVLFEPTEDVSAILSVSKSDSEQGPYWATYLSGGSVFDRETWYNSDIWTKTNTDVTSLEINWDISDELSLVSVLTENETDYSYNWDGDLTAQQLTDDSVYQRIDETTSQEFRLVYDGDDLEAVVGIYLSDLDVSDAGSGQRHISFNSTIGADFPTVVTGFLMNNGFDAASAAGLAGQVSAFYPDIDPIVLGTNTALAQEVKSRAFFADVKYSLNSSFDILAGLRFEKEEQANESRTLYTIENSLPNPTAFPAQIGQLITGINSFLHGFAADASDTRPRSSADFDAFLPKLGVSYHVNENITTSLIYQKGFRSGGVGYNTARAELFTYDAEYTDNIELSYRSVWLGGDLMFNANAFFTQWQDQQVQAQLSTRQYDVTTLNAGESEVYGLETEVFYYPSSNMKLTAGLGYAKSEFTSFLYPNPRYNPNDPTSTQPQHIDLTGRSFSDAPTWTANVAMNYDFDSGAFFNINANYQDDSVAVLNPCQTLRGLACTAGVDPKNDARTLVNAQLGYDFGSFKIRLDVKNLLNEDYINVYFNDAAETQNGADFSQHQIGRTRQFSLTLQAEF